jgi:hypothetical protein
MEHQTQEQLERVAHVQANIDRHQNMSRRERLERWAEMLERQPSPLRSIESVEFGSRCVSDSKRADGSPLSVAFQDPTLRAAGLRGDTLGDALEFFGISRGDVHHIICNCHHGRTISPAVAASRVRAVVWREDALTPLSRLESAVAGTVVLAVLGLALALAPL